jgi:lipopolysaccharide biosynthesis glycosyltransferase
VVLQPDTTTMDALIHLLDNSPTISTLRFPDQDVLAAVFQGKWRPLPWWTNALKPERAVHENIWEDSEVRLIHFMWVVVSFSLRPIDTLCIIEPPGTGI